MRALQQEGAGGRPVPNGSLRLGAYLDRWLAESVAMRGRSPNTVENYRWAIDRHVKPALGGRRLRDLSPDDVDELLRAKAVDGLAAQQPHANPGRVAPGAPSCRALRPCQPQRGHGGDLPSAPRKQGRSLSHDEALRMLKAAKGERLEAAVTTGLMLDYARASSWACPGPMST